jgi:FtsH-binding integral membrane protein
MHLITFIIAFIFFLVAAIIFGLGLMSLHQKRARARGFISSGFMVGLLGVVIAAIVFGVFNL